MKEFFAAAWESKDLLIPATIVFGLALAGCPGTTTSVSCKRGADGSIECGVEVHRDGNHDKPTK